MSQIHKCNDGGQDVTGRNTPPDYVPCANQGGEVGSTIITPTGGVQMAGFGMNLPPVAKAVLTGLIVFTVVYWLWKGQKK